MRVDVSPRRLTAFPGEPAAVTISVANTSTVITGHRIRVLGVDPRWVSLDLEDLSLFPDTTGVARLEVTLPPGIPAGRRTVSVEITELTPPFEATVIPLELAVPAELGIKAALDPVSVTGGGTASVAVVVENTGNAVAEVTLAGSDEEGAVAFEFTPECPTVLAGEQAITSVRLRAHRPWFGSPKVRPFTVEAGPSGAPAVAFGAWVQRPRLSRGALALIGLVVAATVFAVVITASLAQVVNKSVADRDLAIQVAQAASESASLAAGHASVAGTVTLLTSGTPVPGVSVDLFQATNTATPVVSTATGASGGYHFSGLAAGQYKLQFQGAGFAQLWYPDSLTPDDATAVTVQPGQNIQGVDVRLGGLPGTLTGQVAGGNTAGATLTVEVPSSGGAPPSTATAAAAFLAIPSAAYAVGDPCAEQRHGRRHHPGARRVGELCAVQPSLARGLRAGRHRARVRPCHAGDRPGGR